MGSKNKKTSKLGPVTVVGLLAAVTAVAYVMQSKKDLHSVSPSKKSTEEKTTVNKSGVDNSKNNQFSAQLEQNKENPTALSADSALEMMNRAAAGPGPVNNNVPEEMQPKPIDLPPDLQKQYDSPPPEIPADLQAQLDAAPPELPEDMKQMLMQPPRVVTIDEVNNP